MSNKDLKKKLLLPAVVIAFMCTFISITLGAAEKKFSIPPLIFGGVITSLYIAVYFLSLKANNTTSKENALQSILYEEFNIDKYIYEISELIKSTKQYEHQFILKLRLAAAYESAGDYLSAIDYMLKLKPETNNSLYKAMYYNNLIYMYLLNRNLNKANELYEQGKVLINESLTNSYCASSMLGTLGVREYYQNNFYESERLLKESQSKPVGYLCAHFVNDLYLARIYMQTNREEQAKDIINYISMKRLLPSVEQELEQIKQEYNL